jgi:hypothetical protein
MFVSPTSLSYHLLPPSGQTAARSYIQHSSLSISVSIRSSNRIMDVVMTCFAVLSCVTVLLLYGAALAAISHNSLTLTVVIASSSPRTDRWICLRLPTAVYEQRCQGALTKPVSQHRTSSTRLHSHDCTLRPLLQQLKPVYCSFTTLSPTPNCKFSCPESSLRQLANIELNFDVRLTLPLPRPASHAYNSIPLQSHPILETQL